MSYTLTNDDFLQHLKEKITVLQLLCKSYDNDKKYSLVKEMAVAVRVIAHDGGQNSVSLLTHLGIINNIQMLTTKIPSAPNTLVIFGDGLYTMAMESSPSGCYMRYLPKFKGTNETYLDFSHWWNETVLHDMADDYESNIWYTRKDLILAYSNKEGGAHVDNTLPDHVIRQSSDKISGFSFFATNGTGNIISNKADNTPKDATIRQIVYELLYSLFKEYPNLFDEEYF